MHTCHFKGVNMELPIKVLAHHEGIPLPAYQTNGSVGLDLAAAIPSDQSIELKPFGRIGIPTGIAIELPHGCEAQVRPRSGCSLRDGLVAILGTIDTDYRGEIKVIVHNIDPEKSIIINRGDRIAQLVVNQVAHVAPRITEALYITDRGEKGFGSTGK